MADKRQIAFLHIPKTAGTSLREMIESHFSDDEILRYYYGTNGYPELRRLKRGFLVGHFDFGLEKKVFDDPYRITFLRQPRTRIISQINYDYWLFSLNPPGYSRALEIFRQSDGYAEFIERSQLSYFDNAQVRALSGVGSSVPFGQMNRGHLQLALKNLEAMGFVGTLENFEADARNLLGDIGIKTRNLKENVSDQNRKKWIGRTDELSRSDRSFLDSLNVWDEILYRHAT